ncbi:hypothetical protein HQQ80_13975 [Microbacteriaceae bacterium VKM Ac-2855]|nr:hypothetical protein [Microbacteriaceae bacterium VKM Ac-2855]
MPGTSEAMDGGLVSMRPPLREPLLRRRRLIDAGPIGWVPLTVIQAGIGAGKTVAAAHIADEQAGSGIPVVWGELNDREFTEAGEFWTWLGVLLQRAGAAPSVGASDATSADARAIALTIARSAGPFVLVLDGFDASRLPDVAESLLRAVETLPAVRLVVSGRDLGLLALPIVRSRVPVIVLDGSALAFTAQEFAELLSLRSPAWSEDRRAEAIRGFERIEDGWPLAMTYLLNEWDQHPDKPCDALAREFLPGFADDLLRTHTPLWATGDGSPEAAQAEEVLRIISYFIEVSAEMIPPLFPVTPEQAGRLLARLAAIGILRRRRDREGILWYGHHPIIAARIQTAEHRTGTVGARDQRRTAMALALAESHPQQAQRAALAAQDWRLLESLLARHLSEELLTVDSWLSIEPERIPDLLRPRLPLVRLLSLMDDYQHPRGRGQALRRSLQTLVRNGEDPPDLDPLLAMSTLFAAMVAARLSGDEPAVRTMLSALEGAFEALPDEIAATSRTTVTSMMIQVVLTLIYLEEWDAAEARLAQLWNRSDRLDEYLNARIAGLRCAVSVIRGDIVSARKHLHEGERLLALNPYLMRSAGDNYRFASGVVLMESGDTTAARRAFGDILSRKQLNEPWVARTWVLVQLCRAEDGADSAYDLCLQLLEASRSTGTAMPSNRRLLRNLRASLEWQTGRGVHASGRRIGGDLSFGYRAMDRGDLTGAAAVASGVAFEAQRGGHHRVRVEALLLLAEVERAQQSPAAAQTRAQAEQLLERYGMSRLPLLTLPDPARRDTAPQPIVPLSKGEIAVLRQISESGTAAATATAMGLSVHTIRDHLKAIYRKLGVGRRAEALVAAARLGLILRPSDAVEGTASSPPASPGAKITDAEHPAANRVLRPADRPRSAAIASASRVGAGSNRAGFRGGPLTRNQTF